MKKIKEWKNSKEFDTKTLITDMKSVSDELSASASDDTDNCEDTSSRTRHAIDLKTIVESGTAASDEKVTQIYEPRPLTPDDDIYEDIIEQFASAPTKPKYWFEEFGDYWSCSCGHINRGSHCNSCGLERDLLRSLFILHKPAGAPGKLNRKLSKAVKEQIDQEEKHLADKENRRRIREQSGDDELKVVPIITSEDGSAAVDADTSGSTSENAPPEDTQDTPQDPEPEEYKDPDEDGEQKPDSDPGKDDGGGDGDGDPAEDKEILSLPVPASPGPPQKPQGLLSFRAKIMICIVLCLILIAGGATAIYHYLAAPAMKYQDAQDLQAAGEYDKAIEKYTSLGDYKDCDDLIWECYRSKADRYYENGEYSKAIETYDIAIDLKDDDSLHESIRKCHIGIGDHHMKEGRYIKALSSYYVAADMKETESVTKKISRAKFGYVKANKEKRTSKVEEYMSDLMAIDYPGISEIYDEYYAWHVNIVANRSEDDHSSDIQTVSRKDTVYFHAALSGGEPSEKIMLYYEVTWPNGVSQVYNLDTAWKSGSVITARFQYPIPLFGKEGKLTFKLYDQGSNELMASDTVTFKN